MSSAPVRYSSPDLARKIAQNYGKPVKTLKVKMVASAEVSSLLVRVKNAEKNARSKPVKLD
jgi:hypothetical protein